MKPICSTVAIAVLCASALAACDRKPADGERMPDSTPAPQTTPAEPTPTTPAAPAAGGMGMGTPPAGSASEPMPSEPASAPASAG